MFRRRREERTDYVQRTGLIKSNRPRLVVRRTINNLHVQIVEYSDTGDKTVVEEISKNLVKYGWKANTSNISSSYLTGFLAGLKAVKKGLKHAVLDSGLQKSTKGSLIYAAVLGAIDAGLQIPVKKDMLPTEDRVRGKHIADYATKLDKEKKEKHFSCYVKKGIEPEKIQEHFEEVKKKISEKFGK